MKFFIKEPPEELSPEMRDWLIELQQRISDSLAVLEPEKLILPKNHVAPTRRQSEGLEIIAADGSDWDPGTGEGVYTDNGTTYTKL